ncbi:response regulator transcription factor [Candidatus Leptofilum sp.]|uniref:response regulator transcription factor n=1 Tax=Candidatus Leptofilum sp. TaxID=3241576 RepID=UPI003B5C9576
MASKIKVFVVDSQPLFCVGLQTVLQTADDIQWLGSSVILKENCFQVVNQSPDVLLVTASADNSFLESISAWKQQNHDSKIIAMLPHSSDIYLRQTIMQVVAGCILKTDETRRYIQAIRAVAVGEKWFSQQLLQEAVQTKILSKPELAVKHLTEQDIKIMQLVCIEKSNAEIAAALYLSERTVSRYLEDIYEKLGVSSRAGAAVQATKMGLA